MDCEEVSERVGKGVVGRMEGWIVKRAGILALDRHHDAS